MREDFLSIPNIDIYIVAGILVLFFLMETIAGALQKSKRSANDWIQEVGSFAILGLITKPLILFSAIFLGQLLFPSLNYVLNGNILLLNLLIFLLVDDFLQYWYHRSAHEYEFLWKLHRPHHQAEEMGFFVSYRNAALYYLLMPNIWWIGIFTFLGGAYAIILGVILKQIIIISSHSTLSYDKILYRYKWLSPIVFVWERIFITPAFHHSHHGKSQLDGTSDPNGNFGNMFSIWDQFFGTASFHRAFPSEYGLQNNPKENWKASYLYPVIKSKDPKSELSSNYSKTDQRKALPSEQILEKGRNYLWCRCGFSKNQPYCDGNHHGTKFKPLLFQAKSSKKSRICSCKLTKTPPYCDDSHTKFSK